MALFASRWLVAVLILVSVLLVLFLVGKRSVHTEIEISASPDRIWSVLTDYSTAAQWNKVLLPVEGDLQVGNRIRYEFYQEENGEPSLITARVKQLVPNELINQTGGIPGVLTFDHQYVISYDNRGVTTVIIQETYRGVMVPFWNPKPVERAYARLLSLLKARVLESEGTDEPN
ncbi:MAG: SRPBCC family protein [Bacteroidota bacterium]